MNALYGLVLAGGRSSRMREDKAALTIRRRPQLELAIELLAPFVSRTWVSVREDQRGDPLRAAFPQIVDGPWAEGPIAGIIAAQAAHPEATWLVVACDLPLLDAATLSRLLAGRDSGRLATAFRSAGDGLPEPLCAIYEPASREAILHFVAGGISCPRKFLIRHDVALLVPASPSALANANTPEELAAVRQALAAQESA
ncbi:MAG: molybdenum cofactor guanylyltransferase [Gammaproteobacteria bacterium]|nr:molybdenum cofactor guanylyltransferase [Gammaproteobacteria bacterium]